MANKPDCIGVCNDCAFFIAQPVDDGKDGYCHARPPIPVQSAISGKATIIHVWPLVKAYDWCGDWILPGVLAVEMEERIAGSWGGDRED